MSIRRDGLGCIPLILTSAAGLAFTSVVLSPFTGSGWHTLSIVFFLLLPLAYFWSPKRPSESTAGSIRRAARFHRTVWNELGVDEKLKWWRLWVPNDVQVQVGDGVLPLRVKRRNFRKYPDVGLKLPLADGFPGELDFSQQGLLRAGDSTTGDRAFDDAVRLKGPGAAWTAALDKPLRDRVLSGVLDRRIKLKDGVLHGEVHGLDLKDRGVEHVQEFIALAADLTRATQAPIGDRLLVRARNDSDVLVRAQAFRHLSALEGTSNRFVSLRGEWLQAPEALMRITAADQSETDVALAVLLALAADASTPIAYAALAVRRIGALEHDVVAALRSLEHGDPEVQSAIAEELAKRGEVGGGLALAEVDGGELALAGVSAGELALTAQREGDLALAEANEAAEAAEAADPASRRPRATLKKR